MNSSRVTRVVPRWLVHLLHGTPAPIPWARAIRAAIALVVPLVVGYVTGAPDYGALASIGALPSVTADSAGAYRYRAKRLGGASGASVIGFALGLLAGGHSITAMVLVIGVAAASALISAAGNNASIAALQWFIFTLLGTAQQFTDMGAGIALACFVAGALWSFLVALSGWPVRATSPERRAVAQVYTELAAMLSALSQHDGGSVLTERQQLTTAMNTAYDRLLNARSLLSGRDTTYRKLLNLLETTTPAVEASAAMVDAGIRPPRDVIDHFTALAAAVLADRPLPGPPEAAPTDFTKSTETDSTHSVRLVDALYRALKRISSEEQRGRRERISARQRLHDWGKLLITGPLTWRATLRFSFCVGIAEALSLLLPVERSYWITLTVGVVLKPDFGSVFGRAVLRALGTVVGVGLGAIVPALGVQGFPLIVLIGLFAAGLAIGRVYNYGLLATFITPLIIMEMGFLAAGDWSLVLARLIDTVLGCVIVLVFGYLLWPGTLRPRLAGRLAATADTVAQYAEIGLRPTSPTSDREERSRRRRRAYRSLADLRTVFQQLVVEPSPGGRQAAEWWPVIVTFEQLTDAVTAVAITVEQDRAPPAEAEVRKVTDALTEIDSAIRQQRDLAEIVLPHAAELEGVPEQLARTVQAVRRADPRALRRKG